SIQKLQKPDDFCRYFNFFVASGINQKPLETAYPHLSVVHLFKEPLRHAAKRCALYRAFRPCQALRESFLKPESHRLTPQACNTPQTQPPHRHTSNPAESVAAKEAEL
ncbi:hypothetical protein, partial [Zoogloea sp.]|uniref:hypothetical protein n=1 Tax=Zoogloea sp. TaxID=49181 RepID=UPI0035B4C124